MILRNWPKTERYAFGNIWQQLDVFACPIIDELDDGRVSGRTPRLGVRPECSSALSINEFGIGSLIPQDIRLQSSRSSAKG